MSSTRRYQCYECVLLGNCEQKDDRRPAAQHLGTDAAQARSKSEEAGGQDEDGRWWCIADAERSAPSSNQTGVDDAPGHGARLRRSRSCHQIHDVLTAAAAQIACL